MKNTIKIFAPASISNVAVGFDHLGFAINGPGDEIFIGDGDKPGLHITEIRGAQGRLPLEIDKNTAGVAALSLLKHLGEEKRPLEMTLHKKMPIGSGMGSSAASAVAGAFAVNTFINAGLEKKELLPFIMDGEILTSGNKVADNIAPSLLGGMVLIRDNETLDLKKIYTPSGLYATIIYPNFSILTKDSRNLLSSTVDFRAANQQAANFASFVSALYTSDIDLLHRCLQDLIVEPQRADTIPYFYHLKEMAMNEGVMGFSISGSGPTLFSLSQNKFIAENVKEKVCAFLKSKKIRTKAWVSTINQEGVIKC